LGDADSDIIAIDGKTSRRSHDRRKGRNPLHLVSAWAARQRIVLGQQATEEKSNEITAIPLLLKHLDLNGALVTMDAMGAQTEIARAIRDGSGDYCMSLKKNWPVVCMPMSSGCSTIRQTITSKTSSGRPHDVQAIRLPQRFSRLTKSGVCE
jgi:hypothetical protein